MKKLFVSMLMLFVFVGMSAQNKYTREQVLNMTEDQLMDLSMEDFAEAIKAVGVSNPDELFALIMNKNVSSASKEDEDSFTSPLSTTVITRREMRTYGVTTIEEAFRLIPGMIVSEKTNGIYDIHMRGLNNIPDYNIYLYTENANTLLMIDGRPVQNNVMGAINFDMLPIGIEDVERIEVVRGACSALYGANAVNGVINIITERPSVVSSIASGNVQVGNNNTMIGELGLRRAFTDKIALGITANIQKRERNTDKLYLLPNPGQYIPTRSTPELPAPGDKLTDLSVLGTMIDASNGGEFSLEEIQSMKQLYVMADGDYRLFDGTEPETPLTSMFPDPKLSRETMGVNGYLCWTPAEKMNIFLSGGYQKSHVNGSPANEDIVSLNGRKSETAYINLDANIKDLRFVANYMNGIQEYVVGVPGYKMNINNINISAEYDFKMDNGFSVRPGFFFQHSCADDYVPVWDEQDPLNASIADKAMPGNYGLDLSEPGFRYNYKWHYEDPSHGFKPEWNETIKAYSGYNMLTGLFTGEKDINTIAPSVRVNYVHDGLRLIGAYRADKTSNPDKWSHSWQFGASYSINGNNFVRFVYGRANRGANLVNSCADYTWLRSNMFYPSRLHIGGNDDLTLMHIDNFEVGYRWRPIMNILVDAEAFYSISKDYGAMMANYGAMQVSSERFAHILLGIQEGVNSMPGGIQSLMFSNDKFINYMSNYIFLNLAQKVDMGSVFRPYADVKYSMLPYEVHQMGISVNMDYIISSKLIAKLNVNTQKTTIDNYYEYQQINDIKAMLTSSQNNAVSYSKPSFTDEESAMLDMFVTDPMMNYIFKNYEMTGELPNLLNNLLKEWRQNVVENGMSDYEAMQTAAQHTFGPSYNRETGVNEIGQVYGKDIRDEHPQTKRNGYKHKGTPSFYGMIGLIYKPIEKLEVSAYLNMMGKRVYRLAYGSFDMKQRCTLNMKVGYKPTNGFEIFINAHNLFNSKEREAVMNDKIGGLYTVGAAFNF